MILAACAEGYHDPLLLYSSSSTIYYGLYVIHSQKSLEK